MISASASESSKSAKRKREEEKIGDLFPSTVVVVFSTHGMVCHNLKAKHLIETYEIPEGIAIEKINIAPIGVAALLKDNQMPEFDLAEKQPDLGVAIAEFESKSEVQKIKTIIEKEMGEKPGISYTEDDAEIQDFVNRLFTRLKDFYMGTMLTEDEDVEERKKIDDAVSLHIFEDKSPDPDFVPFTPEQLYSLAKDNIFPHIFEEGQPRIMANKKLVTGKESEKGPNPWTNTIFALNVEEIPYFDLFSAVRESMGMSSRSKESLFVKTSDVVDYLSNVTNSAGEKVVKKIIIVDLSCSTFSKFVSPHKETLTKQGKSYGWGLKKKKHNSRRSRSKTSSKKNKSKKFKKSKKPKNKTSKKE